MIFQTWSFRPNIKNCQMCHQTGAPPQGGTAPPGSMTTPPTNPPPQADWWLTHPTMAACGACHDDVNFATGENHAGGPQINNAQCANCHFPQGELPFDASILGAHTIPQFASSLPGVVFTLEDVSNHSAGQMPTVTFTVKNKAGEPINPSDMNRLNLVAAGPTADYQTEFSESALKATGSNGLYTYTFQKAIPADATGTWTIGIEGYRNVTLLPGTVTEQTARDIGPNVLTNFSVDGSPVAPHPVEVANSQCNHCHYHIQAHGGIRNNVQYCILCHNPTATAPPHRPADQAPAQSIDFPVLIHRLHKGDTLLPGEEGQPQQMTPFMISGSDFSDVGFPGQSGRLSEVPRERLATVAAAGDAD